MSVPVQWLVSGKTYEACLSPLASNIPAEYGLPTPGRNRVGAGYQYNYVTSASAAVRVLNHLEIVGETFACDGGDQFTRAEGRAILADARRLRAQLAEHGHLESASR